jgi:hypothetical protein
MHKRGCFIPAFVAGKPQKWQSYLRLVERPIFFAAFTAGFFPALGAFLPTPDCPADALAEADSADALAETGLAEGLAGVDLADTFAVTGALAATARPSDGAL